MPMSMLSRCVQPVALAILAGSVMAHGCSSSGTQQRGGNGPPLRPMWRLAIKGSVTRLYPTPAACAAGSVLALRTPLDGSAGAGFDLVDVSSLAVASHVEFPAAEDVLLTRATSAAICCDLNGDSSEDVALGSTVDFFGEGSSTYVEWIDGRRGAILARSACAELSGYGSDVAAVRDENGQCVGIAVAASGSGETRLVRCQGDREVRWTFRCRLAPVACGSLWAVADCDSDGIGDVLVVDRYMFHLLSGSRGGLLAEAWHDLDSLGRVVFGRVEKPGNADPSTVLLAVSAREAAGEGMNVRLVAFPIAIGSVASSTLALSRSAATVEHVAAMSGFDCRCESGKGGVVALTCNDRSIELLVLSNTGAIRSRASIDGITADPLHIAACCVVERAGALECAFVVNSMTESTLYGVQFDCGCAAAK